MHFENGRLIISEQRETISCDLLIIAAGFTGCETGLPSENGIELTGRNTVQTAPNRYASSKEGVFTAGDMHRGQSLVVWAREVDEWLMGYTNLI